MLFRSAFPLSANGFSPALEPPIQAGIPGELEGGAGIGLQPGLVERNQPALILHVGLDFNIGSQALYQVEAEVVLGSAAGNEVLGSFVIAVRNLQPFPGGEMVSEPSLAPFVFPSYPVPHQQAIAGVAIPLHHLNVDVLATGAEAGIGIGRRGFRAQVELGRARKM